MKSLVIVVIVPFELILRMKSMVSPLKRNLLVTFYVKKNFLWISQTKNLEFEVVSSKRVNVAKSSLKFAKYTVLPRIIAGSDYSREAIISNTAYWKSRPKDFVLLPNQIKKLSHQIY